MEEKRSEEAMTHHIFRFFVFAIVLVQKIKKTLVQKVKTHISNKQTVFFICLAFLIIVIQYHSEIALKL